MSALQLPHHRDHGRRHRRRHLRADPPQLQGGLDGAGGDVRLLRGRDLPPDAEGADPPPDRALPHHRRRLPRPVPLRWGLNKNKNICNATKIFANSELQDKDVHFNSLKYLFPNNFMTEKYLLQVRWVCARCCTTSPRRSWRSSWASSSSPPSTPAWAARTRYPL